MQMTRMRRSILFVMIAVLGVYLYAVPAHAELSANVEVFARGFNNPRGLTFGPLGVFLFVAEAGLGGTNSTVGLCAQAPPPLGPISGGKTGRISALGPFGHRFTIVDDLPSSQTQFLDVLGTTDIEFIGFKMRILVQAGCAKGDAAFPNAVIKLKRLRPKVVADLSAYNVNNPQNFTPDEDDDPEGNPYSFKATANGDLIVIEANHSTVDIVAPDGTITRLADLAAFLQGYDTPVAVDIDHDGNVFVGSFSEVPFAAAASTIYKITPEGNISVFAQGFTTLIDLAFDDEGTLYVLETSTGNPGAFPFLLRDTGRVTRLVAGGATEVVATGLDLPTAMTFGPDGALYVSNRGHGVGLAPGQGEIVRIDVD